MNLVIDCFMLTESNQQTNGIYELTKRLVTYLGAENRRRDTEHHIMVMGNTHNQKDFDVDGISFLLMEGDPLDQRAALLWETLGAGNILSKLECDRVFFPCGHLPLRCKRDKTVLLYSENGTRFSSISPEKSRKFLSSARRADHVIVTSRDLENILLWKIAGVEPKIRILQDIGADKVGTNELGQWWLELFR